MSLAVSIDPIFWLLCAIGFVVLEAMTWNLVSIWFAVGSAAALLSCLLVQSFRVQAAVSPEPVNWYISTVPPFLAREAVASSAMALVVMGSSS